MTFLIAILDRLGVAERLHKPLAYLGGALLLIALLGALWARGTHYRDQRDVARMALKLTAAEYAKVAAERKASDLANVQRVGTEIASISKETVDDYQARIDRLRADFAERVRLATAANSGSAGRANLPGLSDAAVRADESTCEAQFPPQDALIASEQAERLIALQAWVRKVGAVDTNGE